MSDAAAGLIETATYCAVGDEKRPGLVGLPDFTSIQVCDDDLSKPAEEVTNAAPQGWYVRIMFDELLNPDTVEDLIPVLDDQGMDTGTATGSIKNKKPVTLQCQSASGGALVNIPYDGYYSPSGNAVTWPLGPSVVIKPDDPTLIATASDCEVTINDTVKDKDGNPVPQAQRGPYKFKIAPVQVVTIDPADGAAVDAIAIYWDNVYAMFNTTVDPDSFCTDNDADGLCDSTATTAFTFKGPPTGKAGICSLSGDPCEVDADCTAGTGTCEIGYAYSLVPYGFTPLEFGFGPSNPLETDKDYTFEFNGKVKDQCGREATLTPSVADQTQIHFHTNPFDFLSSSPGNGDVASPLKKPTLSWNNVIDISSIDATEWSITPQPTLVASTTKLGQTAGKFSDMIVRGHYALDTEYTFTLKAGATVDDAYGVTWTNPADITIKWKTQPAILLTATSPKDGATVTNGGTTKIQLSFNQSMDVTTLDAADYSTDPAITFKPAVASGCGNGSVSCTLILESTAPLAPGDYTFTLKSGAMLKDFIGDTYTQSADKVIHFTVKAPTPTPPRTCF